MFLELHCMLITIIRRMAVLWWLFAFLGMQSLLQSIQCSKFCVSIGCCNFYAFEWLHQVGTSGYLPHSFDVWVDMDAILRIKEAWGGYWWEIENLKFSNSWLWTIPVGPSMWRLFLLYDTSCSMTWNDCRYVIILMHISPGITAHFFHGIRCILCLSYNDCLILSLWSSATLEWLLLPAWVSSPLQTTSR